MNARAMTLARDQFWRWTECLLDPARTPAEHRQAAHDWCGWGLAALGVDENNPAGASKPFYTDTILANGKAISPLGAARCLREQRRTAVFLQAMAAALQVAIQRFPGETIHVVEAGCGPLAPLALPFALRYPPERVCFTLLDLHPVALEGARRIVAALGLERSIRDYVVADATTLRFAAGERPHVIACEVLLRALTREPQVAVTRNLAPQLRPGGLFVPERIDVEAALFHAGRYFRTAPKSGPLGSDRVPPALRELGTAFSLAADATHLLEPCGLDRLRARAVPVPGHDPRRTPLQLFTRIQVWDKHRLGDFDSSLNLPQPVRYPAELAEEGGTIEFIYETTSNPGLRVVGHRGK